MSTWRPVHATELVTPHEKAVRKLEVFDAGHKCSFRRLLPYFPFSDCRPGAIEDQKSPSSHLEDAAQWRCGKIKSRDQFRDDQRESTISSIQLLCLSSTGVLLQGKTAYRMDER